MNPCRRNEVMTNHPIGKCCFYANRLALGQRDLLAPRDLGLWDWVNACAFSAAESPSLSALLRRAHCVVPYGLIPPPCCPSPVFGGPAETLDAMASNSQPQRQSFAMSYSQSSVGSLNGPPMPPSSSQQPQPSQSQSQSQSQSHSQSQQSQPQMGSFNASQSTATATSPPRGSQQSAVSYSFTNGFPHGLPNSSHMSHHEDNSGYGALVPYPQDYRPQIYKVCLLVLKSLLEMFAHFPGRVFQRLRLRDGG